MVRPAPWFIFFFVAAGCASPLMKGQECTDSADCEVGLSCILSDSTMTTAACMEDCDLTTTRVCSGGEVCTPALSMDVPRDAGICLLGGSTPEGSPCVDIFECVIGSICVTAGAEQSCFRACGTADDPSRCPSSETCELLGGTGTQGYCAPMTP